MTLDFWMPYFLCVDLDLTVALLAI